MVTELMYPLPAPEHKPTREERMRHAEAMWNEAKERGNTKAMRKWSRVIANEDHDRVVAGERY